MADFYLQPPTPATTDWVAPIARGFGMAQDMQNQSMRRQILQNQMQQSQKEQAALQQFGQTGDPTAFRGVDPKMYVALDEWYKSQPPESLKDINRASSFIAQNAPMINSKTWPTIRSQMVQSYPGLPKDSLPPENATDQQLFQYANAGKILDAQIKSMGQGPKAVAPGGSLVSAGGQELFRNPERTTTVLNPSGGVAGTFTGPVHVLPQPQKPTLLQDGSGNLVPWYPGQDTAGLSKPTVSTLTNTNRDQIMEGLKSGMIAPSMLSKRATDYNKILAEAGKEGIDMNKLESQYQGAKRFATSLNGPQMVRFQGLAKSVVNTIDELKSLSNDMQLSGLHLYNRAKLEALVKAAGNTPQGQLATRYLATANTLKEEFASLAMGGYAPTEPAFALANSQINSNYGVGQMNAALTEVQRLINYRVNAFSELQPITTGKSGGGGYGGGNMVTVRGPSGQTKVITEQQARDAGLLK